MMGDVRFPKKLSRPQVMKLMAENPAAVAVTIACGGARYCARELVWAGHRGVCAHDGEVRPGA